MLLFFVRGVSYIWSYFSIKVLVGLYMWGGSNIRGLIVGALRNLVPFWANFHKR